MNDQDETASSSGGGHESMNDRRTSSGSGTIVSDGEEQEEDEGGDDDGEDAESEADSMSYDYDESHTNTITPLASQSRTSSTRISNVKPPPARRPSSMSHQTDSITTIASTYYEEDDNEDVDRHHHDASADAYHNDHRRSPQNRQQQRPSPNNKDSRYSSNSMSYSAAGNSASFSSSRTSPDSRSYRSVSAAVMRRMKPSTSSVSTMTRVDNNQQQSTAIKRTQSAHVVNIPPETAKRKPQQSPTPPPAQPLAAKQQLNTSSGPVQPRGSHNILPEVAQRRTFYDFMHFSGGVMKHDCTPDEFFLAGDYPQTWDELHDLLRNTQSRLEEDFCDRLQALVDELTAHPELLRRNTNEPNASSNAADNAVQLSAAAAGVNPELAKMFSQTALDAVNYMHYQFRHVHDQFERFRNDTRNEIQGLIQEHINQQVVMQQQLDESGREISRLAQLPQRSPSVASGTKQRPQTSSSSPRQYATNSAQKLPPSSSSQRRTSTTFASGAKPRPLLSSRVSFSSPRRHERGRRTDEEEEEPSPFRTSEIAKTSAVVVVSPFFERLFGRNVRRLLQRIVSNPQNLLHLFCFSMLLLCMAVLAATSSNQSRVLVPASATSPMNLPPPAPSLHSGYNNPSSPPSYYRSAASTTAIQPRRWLASIKSTVCGLLPRGTPFCRSDATTTTTLPFIDRSALDSYNSYYSSGTSYSTSENQLHSASMAQQEQYYRDKMQHPPGSSPYVAEYNAMGTPPYNKPTPMDVLNNYF